MDYICIKSIKPYFCVGDSLKISYSKCEYSTKNWDNNWSDRVEIIKGELIFADIDRSIPERFIRNVIGNSNLNEWFSKITLL
jgi:hypothetical protein